MGEEIRRMMSLAAWLKEKRMSHADFADRIGVERSSVSKYAAGRMPRSKEVMRRITDVTGGAVTANDFLDDEPGTSDADDAHEGQEPGRAA